MKVTHFIAWFAVILIFIVAGLFFYYESSSLELEKPSESSSLSATIEDIKRIKESYTEAIESKAEFKNIWSLVVLFVAAASAAAVALRAPHVVIITIGALLAFVYGALELQTPDSIIGSLSKARSSLSCLETPTLQLMIAKEKYLDKVGKLENDLEPHFKTLENYSVELNFYLQRLEEVLKVKESERKEAVKAIDNALLIPVKKNQIAIDEINDHLNELERLKWHLTNNTKPENKKINRQLLKKINLIKSLLEDAREKLQNPKNLQSKLSYASEEYSDQLVQSAKIQKNANDQLDKVQIAISELVPTLNTLKVWPQKIEQTSTLAINSVKKVHSTLMAELAQAGPNQALLAKVISGIVQQPITSVESPATSHRESSISQKTTETSKPYIEEIPFTELQKAVQDLVLKSRTTLRKLESKIAKAIEVTKQLEKIEEKYLIVLIKARELFNEKTQTLNLTIENYNSKLSRTINLLSEAEEVINKVDFSKINLEIENCVKYSR